MESWLLWLILAVMLAVGEIFTLSFFLAPFAAGALLAAAAAAAGAGSLLSSALFLLASGGLLVALRPVARAHGRTAPQLRTGAAALTGRTATVVERIANREGVGAIRLEGEIWTARAYLEDEVIEAGTQVEVLEIRGATALVSE